MSTLITRYLHKAPFELDALGFQLPDLPNHPNRLAFSAVLTRIDEPSTRPPGGSAGHRVVVTRAAADEALASLIGMAVNCSDDFSDHAKRTKIGVITEAHIDGQDLVISGHLFEKDFLAEVSYIQANKAKMGASFEISDVQVADPAADIWQIDHLVFTGAALLLKDKAAYAMTSVVAHAQEDPMENAVLDKLQLLGAKLDGLQASMDDSADAEAAKHDEEEAAAHDAAADTAMTAALRAREDQDEEEAARHDSLAAGCHTKAFKARMKASEWHAAQAVKAREAKDEEAATKHEADAARLAAAATESQKAASALQAALDAKEREAEAASLEADAETPMAEFMAQLLATMQGEGATQKAAAKPMSDAMKARMFDLMSMAGMTFQPGMNMKKKAASAAHDDEEDDKALFKKMMKQDKKAMAASAPDLQTRRKLRDLQASVELLTDAVSKLTGLLTDGASMRSGLLTDKSSTAPNGGQAPVRRSMAGGSGEQWADKYAGQRSANGAKKTELEFTKELVAEGITDSRDQMTRLVEARLAGELV